MTVYIVLRSSTSTITSGDIAQQKAQHDESIHVYNKCQSVEQELRTQLVEAIPGEYLDALQNPNTTPLHYYIQAATFTTLLSLYYMKAVTFTTTLLYYIGPATTLLHYYIRNARLTTILQTKPSTRLLLLQIK